MELKSETKVTLSVDEFKKIADVTQPFVEKGIAETPPKFVLFMGGSGAGKTTIRHAQYPNGYVHFEYGEVYVAFEKAVGKSHPDLAPYAMSGSGMIISEALDKKLNIVTEIIGGEETKEAMMAVIDGMRTRGYEIAVIPVVADIAESYRRHLKAVDEDPDYVSAHFSEKITLSCLQNALAGERFTVQVMKKFYVEIVHPTEPTVLWHYFAEAYSKEAVRESVVKKFMEEQRDGVLLETGGKFRVSVSEEKE